MPPFPGFRPLAEPRSVSARLQSSIPSRDFCRIQLAAGALESLAAVHFDCFPFFWMFTRLAGLEDRSFPHFNAGSRIFSVGCSWVPSGLGSRAARTKWHVMCEVSWPCSHQKDAAQLVSEVSQPGGLPKRIGSSYFMRCHGMVVRRREITALGRTPYVLRHRNNALLTQGKHGHIAGHRPSARRASRISSQDLPRG